MPIFNEAAFDPRRTIEGAIGILIRDAIENYTIGRRGTITNSKDAAYYAVSFKKR